MEERAAPRSRLSLVNAVTAAWERTALAVLLALHVAATCTLLPPSEILRDRPLYVMDQPVNTHRVYLYRTALYGSGVPWGYDPAVSAGVVMDPYQDIGTKPQQVLGALTPFLSPSAVIRLFIFFVALTIPVWTLLACRQLGLSPDVRNCVLLSLLVPAWLYGNLSHYFEWGVVSYVAASYFAPYALTLFLAFLARPAARRYLAFLAGGSVHVFLHVLGPVVVLPWIALSAVSPRPLGLRWRILTVLSPLGIAAINSFWFLPAILGHAAPRGPRPPAAWVPHMTYLSWADLMGVMTPDRILVVLLGLGLAVIGFRALRGQAGAPAAIAFTFCGLFALAVKFFGSFVPPLAEMQPARFVYPAFVLLVVPIGAAGAAILRKLRFPVGPVVATIAILAALGGALLRRPDPIPLPPSPDPLAELIQRWTGSGDRLLVQAPGHIAKVLPLYLGREVVGSTFPDIRDPAQFNQSRLWSRDIDAWSPGELRSALERWGISWAIVHTREARALFAAALGAPADSAGLYQAYRVTTTPTRFLKGSGRINAAVNRLILSGLEPADGLVIIKYRYHPAWKAPPGVQVQRYRIPEDPVGFIAIRNPPRDIVLRFDPWAALTAAWPPG